jgi:general secretion pathway protein F
MMNRLLIATVFLAWTTFAQAEPLRVASLSTVMADLARDIGAERRQRSAAETQAGEQTRLLPLVLQRVADYLERRQAVQQKIQLALIYPAVLSLVSILVVGGLLTFVVPEIVKVFEHTDHALPGITLALLAVSDFTGHYWPLIVLAGVAAVWGFRLALQKQRSRRFLHVLALRLPVLSGFARENDGGRFARTLGILLNSGLSMLDALFIAEKSVVNMVMREELAAAAARVLRTLRGGCACAPFTAARQRPRRCTRCTLA